MATPHKTSTGAVALLAIVLALNLLSLPSDACGSKCCSCPKPSPTPSPRPPSPATPRPPSPATPRPPSPATPTTSKCPVNTLKLGVCTNVLGWLTNLQELGLGSQKPCCELIGGLADLDAAVCLCTALRANVLGIVDLNLPVQLSLLVNYCDKKLPAGFQCPNN